MTGRCGCGRRSISWCACVQAEQCRACIALLPCHECRATLGQTRVAEVVVLVAFFVLVYFLVTIALALT